MSKKTIVYKKISENKNKKIKKPEEKFDFENGNMWEGGIWNIIIDMECSAYGGGDPCKHCYDFKNVIHTRSDKSTYSEKVWTCPRVIVVENEGGFNSTGLCLDCVLEATIALASGSKK